MIVSFRWVVYIWVFAPTSSMGDSDAEELPGFAADTLEELSSSDDNGHQVPSLSSENDSDF